MEEYCTSAQQKGTNISTYLEGVGQRFSYQQYILEKRAKRSSHFQRQHSFPEGRRLTYPLKSFLVESVLQNRNMIEHQNNKWSACFNSKSGQENSNKSSGSLTELACRKLMSEGFYSTPTKARSTKKYNESRPNSKGKNVNTNALDCTYVGKALDAALITQCFKLWYLKQHGKDNHIVSQIFLKELDVKNNKKLKKRAKRFATLRDVICKSSFGINQATFPKGKTVHIQRNRGGSNSRQEYSNTYESYQTNSCVSEKKIRRSNRKTKTSSHKAKGSVKEKSENLILLVTGIPDENPADDGSLTLSFTNDSDPKRSRESQTTSALLEMSTDYESTCSTYSSDSCFRPSHGEYTTFSNTSVVEDENFNRQTPSHYNQPVVASNPPLHEARFRGEPFFEDRSSRRWGDNDPNSNFDSVPKIRKFTKILPGTIKPGKEYCPRNIMFRPPSDASKSRHHVEMSGDPQYTSDDNLLAEQMRENIPELRNSEYIGAENISNVGRKYDTQPTYTFNEHLQHAEETPIITTNNLGIRGLKLVTLNISLTEMGQNSSEDKTLDHQGEVSNKVEVNNKEKTLFESEFSINLTLNKESTSDGLKGSIIVPRSNIEPLLNSEDVLSGSNWEPSCTRQDSSQQTSSGTILQGCQIVPKRDRSQQTIPINVSHSFQQTMPVTVTTSFQQTMPVTVADNCQQTMPVDVSDSFQQTMTVDVANSFQQTMRTSLVEPGDISIRRGSGEASGTNHLTLETLNLQPHITSQSYSRSLSGTEPNQNRIMHNTSQLMTPSVVDQPRVSSSQQAIQSNIDMSSTIGISRDISQENNYPCSSERTVMKELCDNSQKTNRSSLDEPKQSSSNRNSSPLTLATEIPFHVMCGSPQATYIDTNESKQITSVCDNSQQTNDLKAKQGMSRRDCYQQTSFTDLATQYQANDRCDSSQQTDSQSRFHEMKKNITETNNEVVLTDEFVNVKSSQDVPADEYEYKISIILNKSSRQAKENETALSPQDQLLPQTVNKRQCYESKIANGTVTEKSPKAQRFNKTKKDQRVIEEIFNDLNSTLSYEDHSICEAGKHKNRTSPSCTSCQQGQCPYVRRKNDFNGGESRKHHSHQKQKHCNEKRDVPLPADTTEPESMQYKPGFSSKSSNSNKMRSPSGSFVPSSECNDIRTAHDKQSASQGTQDSNVPVDCQTVPPSDAQNWHWKHKSLSNQCRNTPNFDVSNNSSSCPRHQESTQKENQNERRNNASRSFSGASYTESEEEYFDASENRSVLKLGHASSSTSGTYNMSKRNATQSFLHQERKGNHKEYGHVSLRVPARASYIIQSLSVPSLYLRVKESGVIETLTSEETEEFKKTNKDPALHEKSSTTVEIEEVQISNEHKSTISDAENIHKDSTRSVENVSQSINEPQVAAHTANSTSDTASSFDNISQSQESLGTESITYKSGSSVNVEDQRSSAFIDEANELTKSKSSGSVKDNEVTEKLSSEQSQVTTPDESLEFEYEAAKLDSNDDDLPMRNSIKESKYDQDEDEDIPAL